MRSSWPPDHIDQVMQALLIFGRENLIHPAKMGVDNNFAFHTRLTVKASPIIQILGNDNSNGAKSIQEKGRAMRKL